VPGRHGTDHRQTDTVAVAAAKASMSRATGHRIARDPRLLSMRQATRGRRRPDPLGEHRRLWPHVVQSVAQGAVWHFVWGGRPEPTVSAEPEIT